MRINFGRDTARELQEGIRRRQECPDTGPDTGPAADGPNIGYEEADVGPDVEDMQAEIRAARGGRGAYRRFLGY